MVAWNIDNPTTEYFDHNSGHDALQNIINEVGATQEVSIDTETTGLINWKDLPLYWSLGLNQRRATLNVSALPFFQDVFTDPNKRWIMANAKYDTHILANVGTNIAGSLIDTQVMHSLLYDDHLHNLKYMCKHLFGWTWSDFQDTFGKIGKKQSPEQLIRKAEAENFPLLIEYAANDAWGTLKVYEELKTQLQAAPTYSLFNDTSPYIDTLWDLYDNVERPYTKVLWKNERRGILVDQEYLAKIEPIAKKELDTLERAIVKEVGRPINPNSPAQLVDYFFNQLGMKPGRMTKGGKSGVKKPSLAKDELEKIDHPVAKMLTQHRKLKKLYGTYIVGISDLLDPNGRVHTTLNQDITRTGRLSSKDPNLQNIPIPENDKWGLRNAFIAAPEHELLVGDYSQLEMRLLACASLEPGMISIINKGWDIHMGNASLIFGLPYDDIKLSKQIAKEVSEGLRPQSDITDYVKACLLARASAKTIGFGLVYGMGAKKMARDLGLSKQEAQQKIAEFMRTYPAIAAFKKEAVREAERTGFTFTIMGRRRNNANINSFHRKDRSEAERIAVNTPIQGSAADVVKMAQIRLDDAGLDRRFGCYSILQIHDEIIHEVPKGAAQEARAEIKDWMETPFSRNLAVPVPVDIGMGASWMAAK